MNDTKSFRPKSHCIYALLTAYRINGDLLSAIEEIGNDCFECRSKQSKTCDQRMGSVLQSQGTTAESLSTLIKEIDPDLAKSIDL